MTNLLIYLAVAAIVILGTIFIPKLKDKFLNDGQVDGAKKAIDIAELILSLIQVDPELKKKANFVLDLADIVADYVDQLSPNGNQTEISLEIFDHIVEKLGLNPTENDKKLIEIIISESLKWHNQHK